VTKRRRAVRRLGVVLAVSVVGCGVLLGTASAQGSNSPAATSSLSGSAADRAVLETQLRELAELAVARREALSGRRFDQAYRQMLVGAVSAQSPDRLQDLLSAGDEVPLITNTLGDSAADLVYTPVTPCRVFDTRFSSAGIITGGTQQNFFVVGTSGFPAQGGNAGGCGIPLGPATSVIINFAAVNPAGAGNLRAWAVANPQPAAPQAAVMNFNPVLAALANGVAVPVCNPAVTSCTLGDLRLQADASSVHVVGDVVGFFARTNRSQIAAVKAAAVPVVCPAPLTTTEADMSTVTVTFPAAGAAVVNAQASFNANTTGQYLICNIYQDGTSIFTWDAWDPGDADGFYDLAQSRQVTTNVTAGTHTYKVGCSASSGTVSCAYPQIAVQFFGGGTLP
jgi:hypothetical protein